MDKNRANFRTNKHQTQDKMQSRCTYSPFSEQGSTE